MGVSVSGQGRSPHPTWLFPFCGCRSLSSQAAGAIGKTFLCMIDISFPVSVDGIEVYNFATVAGNIIVGIYKVATNDTPVGGAVITQSASTAMAGANQYQFIPFPSAVSLTPGQYYLAAEYSDVTATFGESNQAGNQNWSCAYTRGGGFGALTDPCPAISTYGSVNQLNLRMV